MTRDDLTGMLGRRTSACGPARDALIAGGTFVVWDGLVPANELAGIYRRRLRFTQKRGQPTLALSATVDLLSQAAEEPIRIGRIDTPEASWTFMLFLNATATDLLACTGVARTKSSAEPGSDAK
ncbi:hypothetical protein [Streptomyces fuscigenes]|uniref:hypothetical protein n=1 Tax=Streptomyces fuscigenes TaxID=1528880 RepID=UPI001F1BC16D|nr:hypothetical protein [Streptomyces fuscigenes]MCF3962103.1 hypothetical protein [Streptomyces fuscigenes]